MSSLSEEEFSSAQKNIHFAVIPDGNRRYGAEKEGSKIKGYDEGVKALERLLKWFAKDKRVKILTVYALSEDNWKRPDEEIDYILKIFRDNVIELVKSFDTSPSLPKDFTKKDVFKFEEDDFNGSAEDDDGDESESFAFKFCSTDLNHPKIPKDIKNAIEEINLKYEKDINEEKATTKVVNICFSYDGRKEIIQAFEKTDGKCLETLEKNFLIKSPPDLILRTSGEKRLSGFLPWQSVYSELFFVDKKWPEMCKDDFENAIEEYFKRQKRYGK